MDKRCAVQITQVANGFIVERSDGNVQRVESMESMMVFDSVTRLADWLAVHFAREDEARRQRALADEQELLAMAMRNVDGVKGGYSASWVEGRSK